MRQPISPRAPLRGHPGNAGAAQLRAALGRTARRVMLALGVLTAGGLLVLALIATALLVHGGLLADMAAALFAILAAGLAGTAALVWLARRRWLRRARTAAALPVAGPSWQSLATRAARLLLNGRALERLLARLAARA